MGCCNATAPQRRLSLAPFNLFMGRKIRFLRRAARLHMRAVSVILIGPDTKVLETGNGIKMWSEPLPPPPLSSLGGNRVRRETCRLNSCPPAAEEAMLTRSAGVYGFSSQRLMSHHRSQQALTGTRYLLLDVSPPMHENPKSF